MTMLAAILLRAQRRPGCSALAVAPQDTRRHLSSMARDFTNDQNPRPLVRGGLADIQFPAYTDCPWPSSADVQGLTKEAFADPEARLHPVHTKVATFLSAVYCAYQDAPPAQDVVDRIKQAAAVHQIEADVLPVLAHLMEVKQAREKEEDMPDQYALKSDQDGQEHAFYPMGTSYDVDLSVTGVTQDMRNGKLPVKEARQACLALVKRAGELNIPTDRWPDQVQQLGSRVLPSMDTLYGQAEWRERQSGCDLYKSAVDMYAQDSSEDSLQTAASTWEQLDDMHGIKQAFHTPGVIECWFTGVDEELVKRACRQTVWFGEEAVPAAALATVPPDVYSSWYGAQDQTKIASIFQASQQDGTQASLLLDQLSRDERAVLAGHLTRYHKA